MITATKRNLSAGAVTIPVSEIEEIFKQIAETLQRVAKNEYQFINSCKEFFQFEEPKKYNLMKQFLNKPNVINLLITNKNETISSTKRDTDLLLTYRDGVAASSNKLLHKNKSSFLLLLYSDDISVTNPLGPKKDEKELPLFYYIIDDMPPIVRSLLSSTGFLGIYLTKFLSNTTYRRKFFETMTNDLNTLQTEGLIVSTSTERLDFTFNLIAADNLAANDYGGFQKNFSNGYFCRMCYMSYALKYIPITGISFRLRSEESHEQHLQKALQSNDFIFGIQRQSDFLSLIGFHPIKSLPFDIMHDFSEGTCMVIVKSILKEFSMRRILTYAQIENRFESFIYGQNDEPNRPPPVRQKHLANNLISGSAAQKLLLFQVLPLIFYDVIDRLNDLMPIYKCLREIVSIVFSTKIRKSWLPYLSSLTNSFHSLILDKLPEQITAKVQFITHYPELIRRNGPPRNYWCQRFEGKHLYFKKLALRSSNFKNISFTLAKRHQLRLSWLLSHDCFYNLNHKSISTKFIKSLELPIDTKRLLVRHKFDYPVYEECQTLIHNPVKFMKNSVFTTKLLYQENIPEFVLLRRILKVEKSWILIVQHLQAVSFDETLWSYEISYLEQLSVMNLDERINILSHGLDIYSLNDAYFVNVLTRLTV
ncbi:unnamed protein product [Rotaria socialis]|uniref:Uncharacterized protein n=1 Tax=Rotaria socialis TaxID=392032 RepID=A0A818SQ86_9BILA|nr:unnamed protein product [Rotaria socialis]